jgi:hypothetical protein
LGEVKMKNKIYPKNKEYFKKLVPFAQRIIGICNRIGIKPVIYGSFAQFYYTNDKNMKVNDIDIIIPKKDFEKISKLLKQEGFNANYIKAYSDNGMSTIIVTKGNLKVEIDQVLGYKTLNEESLSKDIFEKIDFYGTPTRMITLPQLEDIYITAYGRTRDDKVKIRGRINHLENFLGRKIAR